MVYTVKYKDLIKKYEKKCLKMGKDEGVVKFLLLHVTQFSATEIFIKMNEKVEPNILEKFENLIRQNLEHNIPVQHLIGYTYFFGNKFLVSKDCLIPRKETEELVENFLYIYDEIFPEKKVSIVDIGTGSGCIGLTIKKELNDLADVTLTDISSEALEMAKKNQNLMNIEVDFKIGNMLEPLNDQKFDCILSNPPYIPKNENVVSLVKDNEPHIALFGGEDGLKFYRIILSECTKNLNYPNIIGFEHAFDKKKEMYSLAKKYFPNSEIRQIKDMQDCDRMTFIINRKKD